MKKFAEKRWVRALAAVLFFLCLAGAAGTTVFIQYGRSAGWYSMPGDASFADTYASESYVCDGLWFVSSNMRWKKDVTADYLGSYAGEAFSYVVKDPQGNITADTRKEGSVYVTEIYFSLEDYSYSLASSENANYTAEGYVNLPVQPYQGCFSEYILFAKLFSLRYFMIAAKVLLLLLGFMALLVLLFGAAKRGRAGRLPAVFLQSADGVAVAVFLVLLFRTTICTQVAELIVQIAIRYTGADSFFYCYGYCLTRGGAELMLLLGISFVLWYSAGELGAGCFYERLILRRFPPEVPAIIIPAANILLGIGIYYAFYYGMVEPKTMLIWLILLDVMLMALLLVYAMQARKIRRAARELAAGNLTHKTDTEKLHFIWRDIGGDLNSIGDGMTVAVEERLKSERMKTELITNVSHDLKTPLTSIINYIDLLKNSDWDAETRGEYIAILERQSAKLKKLTEDVVEASKAASGAISVQTEHIDVRELLEQFLGEYSERMAQADVEPVLSAHCDGAAVMADSALLGRVIENLITNIIKYAMPGTRAYFELSCREGQVVIVAKNVSREPLNNITASELLERFVRGDSSRHSEGSGLGLSIAQSLTELMGGALALVVDGDLFKVELTFNSADPEQDKLPNSEEENRKSAVV